MDRATIMTYRYVRLGIVAAAGMLGVAVLVQIANADWTILGSISAYYYTPARDVFVGATVAGSLGLVAVRGRPGWEDVLLDLAGLLLPVVAFLPTPIAPDAMTDGPTGFPCPDLLDECVPPSSLASVEVGLTAWSVAAAVVIAVAVRTLRRSASADRAERVGVVLAGLVWLVVTVLLVAGPDSTGRALLLRYGHDTAAVAAFLALIGVARINATRSVDALTVRGRRLIPYSRLYRIVWSSMAVVLGAGLAAAVLLDRSQVPSLVFWVEAALLALFAVFWIAQTREFWEIGLPHDAAEALRATGERD